MSAVLSYAKGEDVPELLTETIGVTLARTTETFGANLALVDAADGRQWTYTEFRRDVRAAAAGLLRIGVRVGDRVGLWSPNRAEWPIVQYATAEIGAILVNINPAYRQTELEYALNQSGVGVVLATDHFKDSEYAAMLAQARPACPALREVVLFDSPGWQAMLTEPTANELAEVDQVAGSLSPDDPINIQYTSGTTGFPKGATLSHRNIGNNGYLVGRLLDYTDADRICLPVPFYHCFGMVMGNLAATSHGAAMVIPAPAFDPEATLRAVETYRCTSLYGVPTMFIAELDLLDRAGDGSYDLSSLRTGIMAGSPCPEHVMRRVIDEMHMSQVSICYGMTETSPVSTQTRVDDELSLRVGTVGRVGPHLEIKIMDPVTGETVPRGEVGEFCTRGYSVMRGYWDDAERTRETIDAAGWLHSGDLGVMDSEGYVKVVGRIKDMVIRGGENIYPREIEEFLYRHPKVLDVQVVGIPDQKFGEELCAWIIVREGEKLGEDEVRAFCQGQIAHYKIPRYISFVDSFPMTVTGKIQKFQIREKMKQTLGLQDAATA